MKTNPPDTAISSRPTLPISLIDEDPTNPTRPHDELVTSIKQQGVLQPVMVRRNGDRYTLVYGHRRLRAAKAAGLEVIPATAVDCDESSALEFRIVENIQRENVHPMDEAEEIERLIAITSRRPDAVPGGEIQYAANRLGKTRAYTLRRLVLLKLPKDLRKVYRAGQVTLEIAQEVARIPDQAVREKIAKQAVVWATSKNAWERSRLTLDEVRGIVEQQVFLDLNRSAFDRKDANLVKSAGSCTACPKRTGNAPDLFGDLSNGDTCLDRSCFAQKNQAHWEVVSAKAKEEGKQVLPISESKKLFDQYGDRLKSSSGYVRADAENWSDPKRRTWKKLLAKEAPPVVIARAPSGATVELYPQKAAERAVAAIHPKSAQPKSGEDSGMKKHRQEAELRRETNQRVFNVVLQKTRKLSHLQFLRLIHVVMLEHGGSPVYLEEPLKALGVEDPENLSKAPPDVLKVSAIGRAIGNPRMEWVSESCLEAAAETLRIDIKKIRGGVAAEQRAKQAERKAQFKKAQARKKGAT